MITPKEEEAQLLRIEYGSYDSYVKRYLDGRMSKKTASKKIRNQCIYIARIKERCRKTLDDLPEEYFWPNPTSFELLGAPREPPRKPETTETEYKQADIFEFMDSSGNISWARKWINNGKET